MYTKFKCKQFTTFTPVEPNVCLLTTGRSLRTFHVEIAPRTQQ